MHLQLALQELASVESPLSRMPMTAMNVKGTRWSEVRVGRRGKGRNAIAEGTKGLVALQIRP